MPMLSEDDLVRFRTKICKLASSNNCEFGEERCSYSHNIYWGRRCPYYLRDMKALRYLPKICPDSTISLDDNIIENYCTRGNNCAFAHSQEEVNYHPLVYKTEECQDFKHGNCNKYYCPKIHGLAERRKPSKFYMNKRKGIVVTYYPNIMFIDKIKKSKEMKMLDYDVVNDSKDYDDSLNGLINENIKNKTIDLIKTYNQNCLYRKHVTPPPKRLGLDPNVDYEIERVLAGFSDNEENSSQKSENRVTTQESQELCATHRITSRDGFIFYEDENSGRIETIKSFDSVSEKVEVLKKLGFFKPYENDDEPLSLQQYIAKILKLCDLIKSLAVTSATYSNITSFDNENLIEQVLCLLYLLVKKQ